MATALFWFAFSLPANGLFLLLTRTFFSLQRPWVPTGIAAANLAVTALAALGLYHLGVGGIVAATVLATVASVVVQGVILRRMLNGLELGRLLDTGIRIAVAAAALAAVSFGVWDILDGALGRGLLGQIVSLGAALGLGGVVYVGVAKLLRIGELEQIMRLVRRS